MGNTLLALFLFITFFCGNAEDFNSNPATSTTEKTRTATSTELEIKATLRADNTTIPAGGNVTLTCDLKHSGDFEYQWFRETSSKSRCTLEVGSARQISISKGGIYTCRGRRTYLNSLTIESDPVTIQENDVRSAATLKVIPDSVQNLMYASVSLTCEGNFTEWRVKRFPSDGPLYYSNCGRMTGSTCNISYILKSPTAVYWCESGSGEFSNAVNITVQNNYYDPILVSPVHPVTEGASVSLSCSLRTQKNLSNVFFYHNDKLIQNDTRGELKISAVSKSDEGFYKCQYSGGESAQSWMPIQSDIKSQDSTRSHGDNQDATHEYKSLQHAHYEPYETVHLAEETANGPNGDNHDYETIADLEETANRENEADKAHEGTYSLIELKNSRKNSKYATNTHTCKKDKIH
ncbi:unnamed protein product [Oreochromis niloticus]|nr:unnamed protein product [Mustela putorius furo]